MGKLGKALWIVVKGLLKTVVAPINWTDASWWTTVAAMVGAGLSLSSSETATLKQVVAGAAAVVIAVYTHEHHATVRHTDEMAVKAKQLAGDAPPPPSVDELMAHALAVLGVLPVIDEDPAHPVTS